jgi:hypothetical protein
MKLITVFLGMILSTSGYARQMVPSTQTLGFFEELEGYFLNSTPTNWQTLGKVGGIWKGVCFTKNNSTGISVENIFTERDNGPLLEPTKLVYTRFNDQPWTIKSVSGELESEKYIIRRYSNALVIKGISDDSKVFYCSSRCVDGAQIKCPF